MILTISASIAKRRRIFSDNELVESNQTVIWRIAYERKDTSGNLSSLYSEEAIAQLSDFIGTWNADLSAFGEAYADTELYFTIDENGHGITMMNGEQTTDFEAYAFDNGDKGDGAGIYIAYSNLEYEAEAASYTLETDDAGDTVLTLYAADGVISYKKAA